MVTRPGALNVRIIVVIMTTLILAAIIGWFAGCDRLNIAEAGAALITIALLGAFSVHRSLRPLSELKRWAMRLSVGAAPNPPSFNAGASFNPGDDFREIATSIEALTVQMHRRDAVLERERAAQESVLARLIEGVIVLDATSHIAGMNRTAAALCDCTLEFAIGQPVEAVLRHPAIQTLVHQPDTELNAAPAAPDATPVEIQVANRTLRIQATQLGESADGKIGILLVLNDVTRMQKLERVRRDFVANVSHELKTPITAVKGAIETLRDGALDDPEHARRFLDIALKQADRLNAIIEDLLVLSRLEQESEQSELARETTPLTPILDDVIATCSERARAAGVPLVLSCDAALTARVNRALLEQAVVNLVDNAIKYSEPGCPIRVEADGVAPAASAGVRIRVIDAGVGIAVEHLPRLFERFYRVDKARSRKLGGTGLGLAIVKHIVRAHGGSILAESEHGKGSTFTITLPN